MTTNDSSNVTSSANKVEEMKHIQTNAELEVGRFYWTRYKAKSNFIQLLECKSTGRMDGSEWKYLGDRIWAEDFNNQALPMWDIIGPVPEMINAQFSAIVENTHAKLLARQQSAVVWESKEPSVQGRLFYTTTYKDNALSMESTDTPGCDKYAGFIDGVKIVAEGDFDEVETFLIQRVDHAAS
jgi:hypothetical protein